MSKYSDRLFWVYATLLSLLGIGVGIGGILEAKWYGGRVTTGWPAQAIGLVCVVVFAVIAVFCIGKAIAKKNKDP